MKTTLYLASASPRRHDLLNQIGVPHTVLNIPSPPGEDEPRFENESPLKYVQRTAHDKALRAQAWLQKSEEFEQVRKRTMTDKPIAILTADTTVALEDRVFGKPANKDDAAQILRQLSDKTHTVYTALVLSVMKPARDKGEIEWDQAFALSTTQVSFANLTEKDISEYIVSGEPFGKAGAYGIQGHAAKFICHIAGSYTGVMGLPLFETSTLLRKLA